MIAHPFPSSQSVILSSFSFTHLYCDHYILRDFGDFSFISYLQGKIKGHTKHLVWVSTSRYIISKITVKRNFKQNKKRLEKQAAWESVEALCAKAVCSSFCLTVEIANDLKHTPCSLCRRQIMARYYWMLSLSTWSWLRETTSACTWQTIPWIHQSVSCFKSRNCVCVCEKVTVGIVICPNCVRDCLEYCPGFCASMVLWYQLWCVCVASC